MDDSLAAQKMMAAMTTQEEMQQNHLQTNSEEMQQALQMLADVSRNNFQQSKPLPRTTTPAPSEFRTSLEDKLKTDVPSTPQNLLSGVMENTAPPKATATTAGMTDAQEMLADTPFELSQITRNIRPRGDGIQELTLQLNPAELGKLIMKIRQEGEQLNVEMKVENSQVKQLIEANFNELRDRFLDKDFSFKEMSLNVDIDQRSASEFEGNPYQGKFKEDYTGEAQAERLAAKEAEFIKPSIRRGSDSGLNLYV